MTADPSYRPLKILKGFTPIARPHNGTKSRGEQIMRFSHFNGLTRSTTLATLVVPESVHRKPHACELVIG